MTPPRTALRSTSFVDLIGVIAVIVLFSSGRSLVQDPGVGWHLKTGEWILANGAVPHFDPFLWGEVARPWVSNQWLADLLLWLVYLAGGFPLVQTLTMVVCVLPFAMLAPRWLSGRGASALAMAIGIFICMGLGVVQWYVRPVIFSFLLFAITYWRLHEACAQKRIAVHDFVLLPVLFALWANLHPAFPLGLLLVGLSVLDLPRPTRAAALFALCAAATLINPYGWQLHLSAAGLVGSEFFMNLNSEWLSPDFHSPLFAPLLTVLFLAFLAPGSAAPLTRFERISFAIFAVLALRAGRYVPFFAFVAVIPTVLTLQGVLNMLRPWGHIPPLSAFLQPAEQDRLPTGFLTMVLSVGLLAVVFVTKTIPGWEPKRIMLDQKVSPELVGMLKELPPNSKIFHTPDWGGFLTWELWPTQRAWIDDRNEMNGQEMYEDFLDLSRLQPKWQEVLAKRSFDYLLLEPKSPLLSLVQQDPSWEPLRVDDSAGLFRKRPPRSP